ncbi:MAG TPA: pantetheine-phosphate adenylyltransferase [bacterium]
MTHAAIYPGTFDPITNGHIDLVRRGAVRFDRLVVAIARNPGKSPIFSARERLAMAREALAEVERVEILLFDELLIDFATRHDCRTILRGLRAVSDFEYELQIALTNRKMRPEVETIFLAPSLRYIYLSSSLVKEIASYGGPVADLVPPGVERRLRQRYGPSAPAHAPAKQTRKGAAP